MDTKNDVFEKSRSVRDMQHLRFMALLQELERDHGRKKAAALLGVDRRTLDASLDEGVLSRRIRGALDKALQYGLGSAAAEQRDRNDKLSDRLDDLEGRIEKVANETSAGRRACEEATSAVREEHSQAHREMERAMAGLKAQGAADGGPNDTSGRDGGVQHGGKAPLRREYPDLVTLEPAPGDEEAFGDAWPLIVEWRELKATHPNSGRGLEWLLAEEKYLTVELTLLEEHGLTLPPASFPLRGFDRNGQVNWRRTALSDTRRARARRELLRRVRRVCTLGVWRR